MDAVRDMFSFIHGRRVLRDAALSGSRDVMLQWTPFHASTTITARRSERHRAAAAAAAADISVAPNRWQIFPFSLFRFEFA